MPTKPVVSSFIWASDAVYTTGPAALIGTPTKVARPAADIAQGWRGLEFPPAQETNDGLNIMSQLTEWVRLGSSAADQDAHLVETDATGLASLFRAALGGAATGSPPLTVTDNAAASSAVEVNHAGSASAVDVNATNGNVGVRSDATGGNANAIEGVAVGSGSGVYGESTGSGAGVSGQGSGGGAGVSGVGGATGAGVVGTGGASGQRGGDFFGTGAQNGVRGTGAAGAAGVRGLGGTDSHGVSGQGDGVGHGGVFTGGTTGDGVQGTGGGTSGNGVFGQGAGSSAGVRGIGGATGFGPGAGAGVSGLGGAGDRVGVYGLGSATNGIGVYGQGVGSGDGVTGEGTGTGSGVLGLGGTNADGVVGAGNGTGDGVSGTGGGTNGAGVQGTGGATNGIGVRGTGSGTGDGVRGDGVFGVRGVASTTSGIGVIGACNASATTASSAVFGDGDGAGSGVRGSADTGYPLYLESVSGTRGHIHMQAFAAVPGTRQGGDIWYIDNSGSRVQFEVEQDNQVRGIWTSVGGFCHAFSASASVDTETSSTYQSKVQAIFSANPDAPKIAGDVIIHVTCQVSHGTISEDIGLQIFDATASTELAAWNERVDWAASGTGGTGGDMKTVSRKIRYTLPAAGARTIQLRFRNPGGVGTAAIRHATIEVTGLY